MYYDGLTHRQLAADMDAPLGTVKTWVRRALQKLKAGVERVYADPVASAEPPASPEPHDLSSTPADRPPPAPTPRPDHPPG
ncbi:MAG: sigma factor-like helix-turn-helix DNA-binding protein [Planctomycetota bacterium]